MFTLPLDTLLFFVATSPFAGWAAGRVRRPSLSGAYAASGLAVALWALYGLYGEAASAPVYPPQAGFFSASLRIDMLSVFMASIFMGLGLAVTVYSVKYMERDTGQPLYYTLLLAMISGMVGTVFAGDLFTLFVFWELMCISSYVLVAFRNYQWEPVEASMKYLIMGSAGSATALLGMSFLYGMSGTLSFQGLAAALGHAEPDAWLHLASVLILTGFGVKTAIVPLHTWLPDAHSAAPSSISAMLSGAVIGCGVYALCRVGFAAFTAIQGQWLGALVVLSVLTMFAGNILPLLQTDLKRVLAYSSVAHIGYMLAGLSLGTQIGLTGALMHIFNHALMKGAAFLCAGAIIYRLETRQMDGMAGIGRRMPVTAIAFSISLLALIGLPPLNGFMSELAIVTAAFESGLAWLGVAVVLNSILSAGYYLRILRVIIQPVRSESVEGAGEAPAAMLIPACALVALIVAFGIWPDPVMAFAQQSAAALLAIIGGR